MLLSGKHTLNAPVAIIWEMLMNDETLAKVIPGVSRLERTSETSFKSNVDIKLGPVGGSFSGYMQLEDIVKERSFKLKTQQNSKIGNAHAEIRINLLALDDSQTEIEFAGDVKLSGVLVTIGNRVASSVASTITKQFFSNLEKELAIPRPAENAISQPNNE